MIFVLRRAGEYFRRSLQFPPEMACVLCLTRLSVIRRQETNECMHAQVMRKTQSKLMNVNLNFRSKTRRHTCVDRCIHFRDSVLSCAGVSYMILISFTTCLVAFLPQLDRAYIRIVSRLLWSSGGYIGTHLTNNEPSMCHS